MPRNATLFTLSGLLLVGLVGGSAVAGGGEAPVAPPVVASTSIKQINGEGMTFETTSTRGDLQSPHLPTAANGYALLDQRCDTLGPVAAVPDTTDLGTFTAYRSRPVSVIEESVGPFCAVLVGLGIAQNEPAAGSLLLSRSLPSGAGDSTSPPTAIEYTVRRSTPLSAFLEIAGWAAFIGFLSAVAIYALLRRSSEALPDSYDYGKPWASTAAAVTAVGSSLLAGGGVLASFAPQYQTAGIGVANVVVAAGIAAAPAIVAACYGRAREEGKRRSLAAAGGITVAAIAAQVGLDDLYVLHTNLSPSAHSWVTLLGGGAFAFLAYYVVSALAALPGTEPPEKDGA